MVANGLRIGVLVAAGIVAAGSSQNQGRSPQYPYAQPAPGSLEEYGPPPVEAVFVCTEVRTEKTTGSFCFATQERCDRERQASIADGAQANECRPLAPVACFQLGGDPNPSMEACAATIDDCELLRWIDQDKNRQTGSACALRHATIPGPQVR